MLPGASKDKVVKPPVRRVGSDPPGGDFLSVPKLQQRDIGSTQRLNLSELLVNNGIRGSRRELWLHPHDQQNLGSPSSAAPSEDVSPECVSPAVILVPPPYKAATRTGSKSVTTTPEEECDVEQCVDEVDDDSPRRTSTLQYNVDSEREHESLPRYGFNLRSTSGSSSDVPPDTEAASDGTNPRQTSTDTTLPYTSETDTVDTVPSSSQPSVENNDDNMQCSPPESSVETIEVPVPLVKAVSDDSEEQEMVCVRDTKSSCECVEIQDCSGVKDNGSKVRLVMSVSSEECCEEETMSCSSDK